jgi:hypothetical protein
MMRGRMRALAFATLLLVTVFAAGCGKLPVLAVEDLAMSAGGPRSFSTLYSGYLSSCASCHSPGATDPPANIEQTLDFSTRNSAFQTLTTGAASGLTGAQAPCNGVSFLDSKNAGKSFAFAVLDSATRGSTTVRGTFADKACSNALPDGAYLGPPITDEAAKTSTTMPSTFLVDFGAWIVQGANNN